MKQAFKYIDENNALAVLPIPLSSILELEELLVEIDEGRQGNKPRCISKLVKINKNSRLTKKSWWRLATGKKVDLCITYNFITFDEQEDYDKYFYSYEVWSHGTPQAPMLMLSFDRISGAEPKDSLETRPDQRVSSRRVVSIPIQCILKNWGNVEKGYMIYEHNLSAMDNAEHHFESISYIGLTSRNWQTRYKEHQRDALTGSELLFHTSLATAIDKDSIIQRGMGPFEMVRAGVCLLSELQYINLSYEEAMDVEEKMVERSTLYPKGLNKIPGGFAGTKFLHKMGYLNKDRATVDDRDYAAAKYLKDHPVEKRTAPWVQVNWENDEFYEGVIFKRNNTLNKEQVLAIRKYGNEWGFDTEIIANLVGANVRQVRDVLSGKYYSRVQ
ncbi:MAG: hypothetical protein ABW124_19270 [Candidatus Thiodiazotropha sp. 6PLUC9]